MRRTILTGIMAAVAFFGVASAVKAKPACHSRVSCGTTCEGSSSGGFCSGTTDPPAYCYQESVTSDYDSWVFSCHDGQYDYCCDDEYLY